MSNIFNTAVQIVFRILDEEDPKTQDEIPQEEEGDVNVRYLFRASYRALRFNFYGVFSPYDLFELKRLFDLPYQNDRIRRWLWETKDMPDRKLVHVSFLKFFKLYETKPNGDDPLQLLEYHLMMRSQNLVTYLQYKKADTADEQWSDNIKRSLDKKWLKFVRERSFTKWRYTEEREALTLAWKNMDFTFFPFFSGYFLLLVTSMMLPKAGIGYEWIHGVGNVLIGGMVSKMTGKHTSDDGQIISSKASNLVYIGLFMLGISSLVSLTGMTLNDNTNFVHASPGDKIVTDFFGMLLTSLPRNLTDWIVFSIGNVFYEMMPEGDGNTTGPGMFVLFVLFALSVSGNIQSVMNDITDKTRVDTGWSFFDDNVNYAASFVKNAWILLNFHKYIPATALTTIVAPLMAMFWIYINRPPAAHEKQTAFIRGALLLVCGFLSIHLINHVSVALDGLSFPSLGNMQHNQMILRPTQVVANDRILFGEYVGTVVKWGDQIGTVHYLQYYFEEVLKTVFRVNWSSPSEQVQMIKLSKLARQYIAGDATVLKAFLGLVNTILPATSDTGNTGTLGEEQYRYSPVEVENRTRYAKILTVLSLIGFIAGGVDKNVVVFNYSRFESQSGLANMTDKIPITLEDKYKVAQSDVFYYYRESPRALPGLATCLEKEPGCIIDAYNSIHVGRGKRIELTDTEIAQITPKFTKKLWTEFFIEYPTNPLNAPMNLIYRASDVVPLPDFLTRLIIYTEEMFPPGEPLNRLNFKDTKVKSSIESFRSFINKMDNMVSKEDKILLEKVERENRGFLNECLAVLSDGFKKIIEGAARWIRAFIIILVTIYGAQEFPLVGPPLKKLWDVVKYLTKYMKDSRLLVSLIRLFTWLRRKLEPDTYHVLDTDLNRYLDRYCKLSTLSLVFPYVLDYVIETNSSWLLVGRVASLKEWWFLTVFIIHMGGGYYYYECNKDRGKTIFSESDYIPEKKEEASSSVKTDEVKTDEQKGNRLVRYRRLEELLAKAEEKRQKEGNKKNI